jgi:hypothetical protein
VTDVQTRNYIRRHILDLDMGEALALIEDAFNTGDPAEVYWEMYEAAEITAERAADWD